MRNRAPLLALVAVAGALLFASTAQACPIPVFQYSLEYWEPDPYDIVIHHNGGQFSDQQLAALEMLRSAERGEGTATNVTLVMRDYSQIENPGPAAGELPRMEVRYPVISGVRQRVWQGDLDPETVKSLLDSPLRQRIAKHLADRKAAVWVLLESGDRSKDRAARQTLERELRRMEQTLKVPDASAEFGVELGEIYTDIGFELVTVRRDDPQEQMFIEMLLNTERDLKDKEFEGEPMVFPIYGRGLIMYALVGRGINEYTLNSAGEFLTGPCSCQIKASNPGVDVLMAFDWESHVEALSDAGRAGPAGAGGFLLRMEEAEERLDTEP